MKHYLLYFFLLLSYGLAMAQTPAEANAAFNNNDWPAAAKAYAALTEREPTNALYWGRLGYANHKQQQLDQAMHCYQRALHNNPPPPLRSATLMRLGWVWAQRNQMDSALAWFSKAVPLGWQDPSIFDHEPTLNNFRHHPHYTTLVQTMQRQKEPCKFDTNYRQFDFWVGEWDVVTTQGATPAGSSSIQQLLGDCVIYENWTSANSPYSGKSFNVYDRQTQRWQQYWVDDKGGKLFFYNGTATATSMQFYWDNVLPAGAKQKGRLTFTKIDDNTVRQHSELFDDAKQEWTTQYDFTYRRKTPR